MQRVLLSCSNMHKQVLKHILADWQQEKSDLLGSAFHCVQSALTERALVACLGSLSPAMSLEGCLD